MEDLKNRLSKMPIASINKDEERQIQDLERKFGDKFYLIAFDKMS
jgi:uncharacterized phage infection (PIP) family protein YhgE